MAFRPLMHNAVRRKVSTLAMRASVPQLVMPSIQCMTRFTTGRQQFRLPCAKLAPLRFQFPRLMSTEPPKQEMSTSHPDRPPARREVTLPEGRLRSFWNKYGFVGLSIYTGLYFTTWGSIYLALRSGVDILGMLKAIGVERFVDLSAMNPNHGALAISWVMTKFTEPVRLVTTLGITPPIASVIMGKQELERIKKLEKEEKEREEMSDDDRQWL